MTKRRLAAALFLVSAVVGTAAWLYWSKQSPISETAKPQPKREIWVEVPQGAQIDVELNGDLLFHQPHRNQPAPEGGKGYVQGFHAVYPGEYTVHVKAPSASVQRSFWVRVSDAKGKDRMLRGDIPADSGYGTLKVIVE
jgi:hypothetical protein